MELKAETRLCPQLEYDCHSTDFCGIHVCSKPTLKNCCIEFHENLTMGLVANTSHMQGRDMWSLLFCTECILLHCGHDNSQ